VTQTSERAGLVRVTVTAGDRRSDLALPGSVPVAELLPELARTLGVLDPGTAHAGYTLVTSEGRELGHEVGLTFQGVRDGGVLSIASAADEEPARVYDDVVEAMSDTVERDLDPWDPTAGRRTALTAASLLLGIGGIALVTQRLSLVAGAAAGVAAVLLIAAAVLVSRLRGEHEVGAVLAWAGAGYAAVGGLTGTPGDELLGLPACAAGFAVMAIGLLGMFGLGDHRRWLLPAVLAGATFAVAGGIATVASWNPAAILAVAVPLLVISGSLLPRIVLSGTGTKVDQAHTHADLTAEPAPIDPDDVRRDALLGHEVLLAVTVAIGLVLVLAAFPLVGLGLAGALLAVCGCAVVLLRTRQFRVGSEVLVGQAAGVAGLVTVAVAIVVLHPSWRGALAVVLAVVAVVLLVMTLLPSGSAIRRGRLADLAEGVSLVAMLPLLVFATGLVGAVRG
jgi:type VII secretion integral membrane protein EccD